MRILISALSCNASLGSEASVGFQYAQALARRHDVVVLASPPSQAPQGATMVVCDAGSCSFNEVSPPALLRFELRQWLLTRDLRRHFAFDYVHRITPSAIQVPTWASRLGLRLVIGPLVAADRPPPAFAPLLNRPVSTPAQPRWHPSRALSRLGRMVVSRASQSHRHLRDARRILVGTHTALRHVPEPLREKCRLVTYSGVEHDIYVPPASRAKHDHLRLLFVGRLVPYKGVELLLRAAAAAARQVPLNLTIVGEGDSAYREFLVQLATGLGLPQTSAPREPSQSAVQFLPARAREQLVELYQQADIFCFTSICDTYGIALLEAMSCGCVALVSDVAGAGEIVNERNGVKVPLQTPEQYVADYADKIVMLAGNFAFRSQLSEGARRTVETNHDWEKLGSQLLEIYKELMF